ncbi:MAG: hypothetical protein HY784_11175 [Chloroflexi bacterium]|nr:hypothetical protein [Chloroflexota bacterium]
MKAAGQMVARGRDFGQPATSTPLLPPDWLKTTTDSFLDQLFAALNATEGPATITLSLVDLKQRIGGEAGVNAVLTVIHAQPPCTAGEMPTPGEEFTDMPTCRPPDALLESMNPEIQQQLQTLAAQMSDERTITLFAPPAESEPPPPDEGTADGPPDPRTAFRVLRIVSLLSPLPAVVLLGLIALFAVRGWRDLLAWWGAPLALVGLLVFTLAMSGPPVMEWATALVMERVPLGITPSPGHAGYDLVRTVAEAVTTRMAVEAGALGSVGLLMFAGSWRKTSPGTNLPAANSLR